jgi:glycosyltransferase involved in cell wall biosynthesis
MLDETTVCTWWCEKVKEDTEGNLYTTGSYNENVWKRYLSLCDKLSFISRKDSNIFDEIIAKNKFQFLDTNIINFIEIPDMTSSYLAYFSKDKRNETNRIIEDEVLKHDFLIVRLPSEAGCIAIECAKKYNKPYLVEVVGCIFDTLWSHSYKGKVLAVSKFLRMKSAVKNANYAIYVTNEFLQNRYPCNGKTIGCSDVVLQGCRKVFCKREICKIKNNSYNRPMVLGTIAAVNVRYKGQEYVIKAIYELNKNGYNFEYHLVGDGDNSFLKAVADRYNIADKVKFLGGLPHSKIFDYLDSIDIYVQPSKTEGLPRALVEAMSRACPSLGSASGGIPELLNKEFIFKDGDTKDICEIIKKLVYRKLLLDEAVRSFEKSKEFEKHLLNERRNVFYAEFIKNSSIKF